MKSYNVRWVRLDKDYVELPDLFTYTLFFHNNKCIDVRNEDLTKPAILELEVSKGVFKKFDPNKQYRVLTWRELIYSPNI